MIKEDVILVFDVGKTNKKVLLFNQILEVVDEEDIVRHPFYAQCQRVRLLTEDTFEAVLHDLGPTES